MGYLVQHLLCSGKRFVKLDFHLRPSLRNSRCNGNVIATREFTISCLQNNKRELPLSNARVVYSVSPASGHNKEAHPESNLRVLAIVTALERMKITPEYFGGDIIEIKDFQAAAAEDITSVHSKLMKNNGD